MGEAIENTAAEWEVPELQLVDGVMNDGEIVSHHQDQVKFIHLFNLIISP